LHLNLFLRPRGDEGTYKIKIAILFHSQDYLSVSKVKGSVYFVVLWNGLRLKREVFTSETAKMANFW
jgi:hypothetical protein